MLKHCGLALAIALVVLAPIAFADPAGPRPTPISIAVATDGLDLTTPAGVDRLTGRFVVAMERACGARPIPREISRTEQWSACRASLQAASSDYAIGIAFERARARMN